MYGRLEKKNKEFRIVSICLMGRIFVVPAPKILKILCPLSRCGGKMTTEPQRTQRKKSIKVISNRFFSLTSQILHLF